MKVFLTFQTFLLLSILSFGQGIYIKTFGDSKSIPVIFLHGGPGYNCANFEATTAQELSNRGFFVIVYDRRGEGRSPDQNATYSFSETYDDLNNIYKTYAIKKAVLIGHSFGGIVATQYAKQYPKNIRSIILIGAPVSLQESYKNIIKRSKEIYQVKNDSANNAYIDLLEKMDSTSLEYSAYCLGHAMQNNFYSPKKSSEERKNIYLKFSKDSLAKIASKMTYQAPQSFWKNEHYTTLDLTKTMEELIIMKIKIFGLYGKDDGLFSSQQVEDLQNMLSKSNVEYIDNCSHNVFIDQQTIFISKLEEWIK